MNKLSAIVLALIAGVFTCNAGCYYTEQTICMSAGTVVWSGPAGCWAGESYFVLVESDVTENPAFTLRARPATESHPYGFTQVITGTMISTVSVRTERIHPSGCAKIVTPSAYRFELSCPSSQADPLSASCHVQFRRAVLRSLASLAML